MLTCSECGKTILPDEWHEEQINPPDPPTILCMDCSSIKDDDDEDWEDTREL